MRLGQPHSHRFDARASYSRAKSLAAAALGFATVCRPYRRRKGRRHAQPMFHLSQLPITNRMETSWVVAIVLIVIIRLAVRPLKLRPSRGQVMVENLVKEIDALPSPIVGQRVARATFSPAGGALHPGLDHQELERPVPGRRHRDDARCRHRRGGGRSVWLREANADLNMTLALAVVAMVSWLYFVVRYAGPKAMVGGPLRQQGRAQRSATAALPLPCTMDFLPASAPDRDRLDPVPRPISLSFRLYRQRVRRRESDALDVGDQQPGACRSCTSSGRC